MRYTKTIVLLLATTAIANEVADGVQPALSIEPVAIVDTTSPWSNEPAAVESVDPLAMQASFFDQAAKPTLFSSAIRVSPPPRMPSVTDGLTFPSVPGPLIEWSPARSTPAAMPDSLPGGNGGVQRFLPEITGKGLTFDGDAPTGDLATPAFSPFVLGVGADGPSFLGSTPIAAPLATATTPIEFPETAVPEPSSLALLAIGILALRRSARVATR
ncbi:MAG TPA: PEP-CTERM sorting domain-containing protein [Tepidisphaeraceae bacterium]|jgi:hypothetical protein|nr:PEP-CTERM sorting domain-containing protein [Tepidisphaeraceae bacterium]